jgi:hypothetical protein
MTASKAIEKILEKIQENQRKVAGNETEALQLVLEQARLFRQLRAKARRTWLQKLEELGFNPRVVSRLLKIADQWSTENETPGSHLLERLPHDPHKLEWLCRLTHGELEELSQKMDLRQSDRAEVIKGVKKLLPGEPTTLKSFSLNAIQKSFDKAVDKIMGNLEDAQESERQGLIQYLEGRLDQLRMELQEVAAEETEDEQAEEAEEGTSGETASDQGSDLPEEETAEVEGEETLPKRGRKDAPRTEAVAVGARRSSGKGKG